MLSCVAQVDVGQRLLPDAQRLAAELKIQLVAQEGDRGSRVLAQVIDPLTRDDHLDEEAHFGALSIPDAMEDPRSEVRSSSPRTDSAASINGFSVKALRKRMASKRFDLPTPLGPATQVNGPKWTSTPTRFLNPSTLRRVRIG
jgi:hypothetical protein